MSEKLWSHSIAQDPRRSPDLQEALSRRYGSGALVVLPLSSGKLAVFGADRQLLAIEEEAPGLEKWRAWSREFESKVAAKRPKPSTPAAEVDLKELGL